MGMYIALSKSQIKKCELMKQTINFFLMYIQKNSRKIHKMNFVKKSAKKIFHEL